MTKTQLLEYAQEHGITGVNSAMLKADILSVIKTLNGGDGLNGLHQH